MRTGLLATLAAGLLACLAPAAQAGAVEDGNAAYDAGQFGDARQLWLTAAGKGDAQAAFDMGLLYDLGEGVPPDAAVALGWYRRAAEAGSGTAALNVGVMYDSGRGASQNRAEAAVWYARSAALGDSRAAFNIGQLYESGEGVPRNLDAATAWYRMAAPAIPEAAVKATALAAPHTAAAGQLAPPVPVWPIKGTAVHRSGPHPAVQLVWIAPAEPLPVTYFIELQARENGRFDEVAASYVAVSAIALTLPDDEDFAWRVYAVAADGSSYAPSAWMHFTSAARL